MDYAKEQWCWWKLWTEDLYKQKYWLGMRKVTEFSFQKLHWHWVLLPIHSSCPDICYQLFLLFLLLLTNHKDRFLNKIVIYLKTQVFAQGQLYTALSRWKSNENNTIFNKNLEVQGKSANTSKKMQTILFDRKS